MENWEYDVYMEVANRALCDLVNRQFKPFDVWVIWSKRDAEFTLFFEEEQKFKHFKTFDELWGELNAIEQSVNDKE